MAVRGESNCMSVCGGEAVRRRRERPPLSGGCLASRLILDVADASFVGRFCDILMDQLLQPVSRVDRQRPEIMLLTAEPFKHLPHLQQILDRLRPTAINVSQSVLQIHHQHPGSLSCPRRFPDPMHAV